MTVALAGASLVTIVTLTILPALDTLYALAPKACSPRVKQV